MTAPHRRSASTILWIVTTLALILMLTRTLISAGIGGGANLLAQTVVSPHCWLEKFAVVQTG